MLAAMTVTLDVTRSGDVAVLHGLDTEAALAHLCRSLITGSVFDTYPALVIDVGDTESDRPVAGDLHLAAEACLHRHQWLAVVHSSADVAAAVAQARQWRRLVERERALNVALSLSGLWSFVVGATGSVWGWVRSPRI
jgi:hypothetical protein